MKKIEKVAAIITSDNERNILCVKKKGLEEWISPGGKIEPGENHEACLRRELNEELGVTLGFEIPRLRREEPYLTFRGIAQGTTDTEITLHFYHVYIAGFKSKIDFQPANEILYYVWAPISLYAQLPLAWSLKNELLPKLYADQQSYLSRTGGA